MMMMMLLTNQHQIIGGHLTTSISSFFSPAMAVSEEPLSPPTRPLKGNSAGKKMQLKSKTAFIVLLSGRKICLISLEEEKESSSPEGHLISLQHISNVSLTSSMQDSIMKRTGNEMSSSCGLWAFHQQTDYLLLLYLLLLSPPLLEVLLWFF